MSDEDNANWPTAIEIISVAFLLFLASPKIKDTIVGVEEEKTKQLELQVELERLKQ